MTYRCKCKTQSGHRCTRQAEEGANYCWQHNQSEHWKMRCNSMRCKSISPKHPPRKHVSILKR
jgi:hypothetical protein